MDDATRWAVDAIRRRYWHPATGRSMRHPVAQVLARLRVGEHQSRQELRDAWRQAVGSEIAEFSIPVRVSNKVLQVVTADSLVSQEVSLRKREILGELQSLLPNQAMHDIRCKVGRIDD